MLCDDCKERDAVVHLTQIVEHLVTQVHLCEQCAAAKGIETTLAAPKHPLGDFLQAVQAQEAAPSDAHRCAHCGTSQKDFRASGRLGCPQCYGAFGHGLRDLLRRVHGSARHVGRGYTPPDPALGARDATLEELRERLRAAVAREEFEQAASLRDQLRAME